jgi:dihydroxyacid dehydratase/phosphogluconate dehydratase
LSKKATRFASTSRIDGWNWMSLTKSWQKRQAKWKPHPPKIDYGYLARYAAQVTSADTGAVFKKPEL